MNNKFASRVVIILSAILCLNMSKCSNDKGSYFVSFKPKSGIVYKYRIVQERRIDQQIGKEKITYGLFKRKIVLDVFGTGVERHIIFKLIGYDNSDGNDDSTNTSKTLGEKIIDLAKGRSFEFEITKTGDLNPVAGLNEFKDSIRTIDGFRDEDFYLNFIGTDFFNFIFHSISILHNSTLDGKFSWARNEVSGADEPFSYSRKYQVEDIQSEVAHIKSSADFINNVPGKESANFISMKGSETGKYKLDLTSGMIIHSESKLISKGEKEIGKKLIGLDVTISNTVEQVK